MITFTTTNIPGLTKCVRSDGTPVWKLTIQFQADRTMSSHATLEDAIEHYRHEKLRQVFLQWPPFTEAELQAFPALLSRHPALREVLKPVLLAALAAREPAKNLNQPTKPASHQQGLPANQRQKGTGGPVDPDILFAAYARRWFEANQAAWTASTQDINRSLCTKHLNPVFGTQRLRDISATMIEDWLRKQLEQYSLNLCRNMRTVLTSILYAAKVDGLITTNPATDPGCMLPTHATRQRLRTTQ